MTRVVIYARTSTDSQKRRQTSDAQVAACRALATTRCASVLGVFVDDAVAGTEALASRPAAARMLRLCRTGAVDAVVVARLDRLGRRLDLVNAAFTGLPHIELWSVSEGDHDPRESTPSLMQSFDFAARELEVVAERMHRGRDLALLRDGKWVAGPVPFGYDLDTDGRLSPSSRLIGDLTEAELARSVFVAMASGSSTVAEARRLQAMGAAPGRRYSHALVLADSGKWVPSRVNAMLRNTIYKGSFEFESRFGRVAINVPGLVDAETWRAAQRQLELNRGKSPTPARSYLLRGLLVCGLCGVRFAGTRNGSGGLELYYYRCAGQLGVMHPDPADRCKAKHVRADWIERVAVDLCSQRDESIVLADFDVQRAAVLRMVKRVVVYTLRPGRHGEATIVFEFVDGTHASVPMTRQPRRHAA